MYERISIEDLSRRLRHSTIESTAKWCANNDIDIHFYETTGVSFVYAFQYEAVITKKKFLALKKIYGEKSWEQEWQIAMQEYMKRYMAPIILN